jgi:methyltransferase (TIGR00027 family)
MARTDDDSWGITESVGATALGVAAVRAAETNSEHPLIRDPYAQMFLDAAGEGVWNLYQSDDLPAELTEIDPRFAERMQAMLDYTASRTLFFDEFFMAAAADDVTQAVILAAGLDARAWRLDWPAGSVVYEIDQPKVLAFKTFTLESHGVTPVATLVGVPIDLRHDWPAALRDSGFDPHVPTAWSAEGLLPFLSADAQDLLFDRIQALSAQGSRVAVQAFTNDFFSTESSARREKQLHWYRSIAETLGRAEPAQSGNPVYEEQRTEVVDWLTAHEWDVSAVAAQDLMARNGRFAPADLEEPIPQTVFVEGRLH